MALFIVCISIFTLFTVINKNSNIKYVDITSVVKEAFLTDNGYSNELSKHISQEVFKQTNIYNAYPVNSADYKKPFKVDFSLKEDSQTKKNDIVYVKMIYSVYIFDSQNKSVGGSKDIPITFTVKNINGEWYITEKEEPA
ncbi:hypothetical protein G9F73_013980 [Clostridium estertheticum]|uniref:hypothetical protein n=1 Tax=Clostridium estertheticum TaxID=238834 RepID=UPI0013EEC2A6|nr:hypothetical protein [Clostridium estertheticum]MBZ9608909.1 hypothetical protein [Clostridium estertheticum]